MVKLVQGVGDVPPVIEAGESGPGGTEAQGVADVLEGLGVRAGLEPGDDLLLLVRGQGFEGGVGMGLAHRNYDLGFRIYELWGPFRSLCPGWQSLRIRRGGSHNGGGFPKSSVISIDSIKVFLTFDGRQGLWGRGEPRNRADTQRMIGAPDRAGGTRLPMDYRAGDGSISKHQTSKSGPVLE